MSAERQAPVAERQIAVQVRIEGPRGPWGHEDVLAGPDVATWLRSASCELSELADVALTLDRDGWRLRARDPLGLGPSSFFATLSAVSLVEAAERAGECAVTAGSVIEWGPFMESGIVFPCGGLVVGGPEFGEGSMDEWVVCDARGAETLCASQAIALAELHEAGARLVTELARSHAHEYDAISSIRTRIARLELPLPVPVDLRLCTLSDELLRLRAVPAAHFRWKGFLAALSTRAGTDIGTATAGWGRCAHDLAGQGFDAAALALHAAAARDIGP